jgi:F0F1-type ATP synthase assembly protein I
MQLGGKDLGRYLALGQVGLEMVVPIGVGLALDYYLGWSPWGVVVGTVVGFTGGLYHLIQQANKLNQQPPEDDGGSKETP